jgi:hypothetical protein
MFPEHKKRAKKARSLKFSLIVDRYNQAKNTISSTFQSNNLFLTTTAYLEKGTELILQYHGAGNGARTRDTKLGKLVLYQLSYARPMHLYN